MILNSPLDVQGLIGWLETDSDGTPIDQLRAHTGTQGQWIVYPVEGERGIVLHFNRVLSEEEIEGLTSWLQGQREPATELHEPLDVGE